MGLFNGFRVAAKTGTMAAGLGAAAPIYSARWGSTTKYARVSGFSLSMMSLGTGFAAGSGLFELFKVTGFTVEDTDGAAVDLADKAGALQTRLATSAFSDMRIATTATLTAGTRDDVPDYPLASVEFGITTAVNTVHLPTTRIWLPDDDPLTLQQDEGLVLQATVPATGTWRAIVTPIWSEWEPY